MEDLWSERDSRQRRRFAGNFHSHILTIGLAIKTMIFRHTMIHSDIEFKSEIEDCVDDLHHNQYLSQCILNISILQDMKIATINRSAALSKPM